MSHYNSPNHDHIRQLLNQRHASNATPHHSRFPSVSDVSDSPSVYSRSPFTPRPFDKVKQPTPIPTFDDQDQEPSTLDLSDDPRPSYTTARTTYSTEDTYGSRDDLSSIDDDEPERRMSMLGIKMRFHSKAPWEAGGEDIPEEEEEQERNSGERPPSRSKRSIKGFTVRPSVESSRSNKKSLDASQYSIGGALQCVTKRKTIAEQANRFDRYRTLAQASMSSTSLVSPQSITTQSSLRQKLSLPKIRTRAASNSTTSPSSPRPIMYSPLLKGPSSPRSEHWNVPTDAASIFTDRSPSPVSHPYANPELSRAHARDSVYPKSFVSFDTQSEESFHRSTSVTTLTSSATTSNSLATPPHQVASSKTKSRTRDREISGPMPLPCQNAPSDSRLRESVSAIPGWQEQPQAAFSLISLEEARAQRRLTQLDSSTCLSSAVPQPEHSTPPQPRPHTRSLGSGGKAKAVLQSVVTDFNRPVKPWNDPPETPDGAVGQRVKPLKHKKSGFMRIFIKDKAPTTSPPDIPNFSAEESHPIPPVPRTPRLPTHRVPVPPIDPTVNPIFNSSADSPTSLESTVGAHSSQSRSSPKRIIPPLYINTSDPGINRPFAQTHQASNSLGSNPLQPPKPNFASPADNGEKPQSAPPGKTDFVALSLRPVSTVFSSHFAGHLLGAENKTFPEPALDADSGTPTTATGSGGISPLSPDFASIRDVRGGISRPTTITSGKSSSDDSQPDVIRALQGQIFDAKEDWQRHVWGLESQIRDLKAEIEEMRQAKNSGRYCEVCGRGRKKSGSVGHHRTPGAHGNGNRPRAYTTVTSSRQSGADS
ncbi:hypothetical protein BDM02DRAFT_3126741 [Thelephora ganbajun]|uniref:Uncharacterized protein n=1 Tax=Thelephora ganbajun TaxID=370292 RepID=A0ACB6ZR32_THEGA|nr:hypothetical protein BDM02DRAFT_3126741 [Thelephora ganbajun]